MEKQKAAIKFKAAGRIVTIAHDLAMIVKNANSCHMATEADEENHN